MWRKNTLEYLSTGIICSEKTTVFRERRNCQHIFAPSGGYCVYHPSIFFCNTRDFESWGISLGCSPDLAVEYSVT